MSSTHALTTRLPRAQAHARARTSRATVILRTIVLLALIPVAVFYLLPRVYNLVATPYRLDSAVTHAGRYNPALEQIVAEEHVTLAAFNALDRVSTALANVRATDALVAKELQTLIGQIRGDLQDTLDNAGTNVSGLVSSLNELGTRINSLNGPVDGAGRAVSADSASLSAILKDARSTAAKVHAARLEADSASRNVSGTR